MFYQNKSDKTFAIILHKNNFTINFESTNTVIIFIEYSI